MQIRCLTVEPAYGRDYRRSAEAKRDWSAGKDFIIVTAMSPWCGSYLSSRDALTLQDDGVEQIKIRYGSGRYCTLIDL